MTERIIPTRRAALALGKCSRCFKDLHDGECATPTQPDDLEAEVRAAMKCLGKVMTCDGLEAAEEYEDDAVLCHMCEALPAVLAALRKQRERAEVAEAMVDSLGHPVKSPCGHCSSYAVTDDGGKNIRCLLCREAYLATQLAEAKVERDEVAQERTVAEAYAEQVVEQRNEAYGEMESLRDQLRVATEERDKYHDALIARHGGEPVALLSELDEARERLAEAKAEIARLRK